MPSVRGVWDWTFFAHKLLVISSSSVAHLHYTLYFIYGMANIRSHEKAANLKIGGLENVIWGL
jgi:hypothetical protein